MPLLLLLSSSRLFLFPLLCLFFLLFFSLGSFMLPLLLCLSLWLLLTQLRSPSLIPLLSLPLFGSAGWGCLRCSDCDTCTIVGGLCACPGFTPWFLSLCAVPPAVASSSSSALPPLASLLAPPFPLWVCGSRVVVYSGGFSWVVLASGSSAFLPSLFFSASGPPLLSCALSVSSRLCCFCLSSCPLRGSVPCFSLHLRAVGSLSLSLRLFSRSPYLSLLFVPLPLLHLSLSTFGFCFCGSFRSSLVASVAVSSDPQVQVAPFVLPRSSCVVLLFALFSRLLAFYSLLLLVRTLCGASRSGVSFPFFSLDWFERGSLFHLRLSFLFASLLRVASWSFFSLSLPSLLLLLCLYWVLFVLSPSFCWLCSPDLCFPFSSSWAFVSWACACRVLFSGSVGVPLTC